MYCIANKGPVQTAYLFVSPVFLTTELICDMALMAIIPLMARFVWLSTVKLSAEDLSSTLLAMRQCSLSTHEINLLIMNEQRCSDQIVGPGSQQKILPKFKALSRRN
jgi:hypothetical protein